MISGDLNGEGKDVKTLRASADCVEKELTIAGKAISLRHFPQPGIIEKLAGTVLRP